MQKVLQEVIDVKDIAAIVVTYNRKNLLLECLNSLKSQSYPLSGIFIIDGPSTDGTEIALKENGYIDYLPPKNYKKHLWSTEKVININKKTPLKVHYTRLYEDLGGAGGFYTGLKMAFEKGYDLFWLMDDDGLPSKDCLYELVKFSNENIVVGPVVLDIEDKESLAFPTICHGEYIKTYSKLLSVMNGEDLCKNGISFFNGVLIPKAIVDRVGFPKKDMFIWGDEREYYRRIERFGFKCWMVKNAIHYHPKNRIKTIILLGNRELPIITDLWKEYIYWRNQGYICKVYNPMDGIFHAVWDVFLLTIKNIISKQKLKCSLLMIYGYIEGYTGKFRNKKNVVKLINRICSKI